MLPIVLLVSLFLAASGFAAPVLKEDGKSIARCGVKQLLTQSCACAKKQASPLFVAVIPTPTTPHRNTLFRRGLSFTPGEHASPHTAPCRSRAPPA